MSKRLESQNTKFAIPGLFSGIIFSPIGLGVSGAIVEESGKLLKVQACAYPYRINDDNPLVFSLLLLIFAGAILGGISIGHVVFMKSRKMEFALCAAIPGAFVGTMLTELVLLSWNLDVSVKGFHFEATSLLAHDRANWLRRQLAQWQDTAYGFLKVESEAANCRRFPGTCTAPSARFATNC